MTSLRTILVVADARMTATAALLRGRELARRSGARLHVCLFDYDHLIARSADLVHPDVMRLARQQFLAERMKWLARQATDAAEAGLRMECDAVWAPVLHEAILAKVLELQPDLVIKDALGESLLHRLVFTPLDWKILRTCPVPLMLVHPVSPMLPRRVLAAVDTSAGAEAPDPLNERILACAREIALQADADVHLGHAYPFTPLFSAPYRQLESACAEIERADATAFEGFAQSHHVPEPRRHRVKGEPAAELVRLARHLDADLVVLGSMHRSALDRFFLGSTAETLLTLANCDVLLVKPPDFAAQLARHLDLERIRAAYGGPPEAAQAAA